MTESSTVCVLIISIPFCLRDQVILNTFTGYVQNVFLGRLRWGIFNKKTILIVIEWPVIPTKWSGKLPFPA